MMMFMQSTFLEMDYWMLPIYTPDAKGNINAPLEDVHSILTRAFDDQDK